MDTNAQNTSDPNIPNNLPDLNFQPSAPVSGEGGIYIEVAPPAPVSVEHTPEPISEPLAEPAPEVYKVPEAVETISPAPAITYNTNPPTENVVPLPKAIPVVEIIVDKRTNHEKLAKIRSDADLVTLEADKNEEDFITGVEVAHERK